METFSQEPDQFKSVMQLEVNGMKITQTVVVNGDKAWINVNGMNIDLDDKLTKAMKEEAHLHKVARLLDLKKKEYKLSALGEAKVEGQDAVGIQVAAKGHGAVNLYFSKASGLLVKTENRALDYMSMQEVSQEGVLSDYKDTDGLKSPRKVLINRDGKKFLEMEITEVKLLDKHDESVFAKP